MNANVNGGSMSLEIVEALNGEKTRKSNGWTKLQNSMMDTLYKIRIPAAEAQVFWYIFRRSKGYNEDYMRIYLHDFENKTGILKSNVCRILRSLKEKNIIRVRYNRSQLPLYGINPNFEQWGKETIIQDEYENDTLMIENDNPVVENDNKRLSNLTPSLKTKGSKENYSKDISLTNKGDESINRLIQYAARTCSLTIMGKNEDVLKQLLDRHPYDRVSEAMGHFALYQLESEEGRRFPIGKTFDAFVRKFDLFVDADGVDRRLEAERRWHNEHRGNRNNLDPWKKQENPESCRAIMLFFFPMHVNPTWKALTMEGT